MRNDHVHGTRLPDVHGLPVDIDVALLTQAIESMTTTPAGLPTLGENVGEVVARYAALVARGHSRVPDPALCSKCNGDDALAEQERLV